LHRHGNFATALGFYGSSDTFMTQSRAKPRISQRLTDRLIRKLGPWGMFLKGFAKHPVMVGSIIPSSPTLIANMLGPVEWDQVKLFVEYGPGVGTFCRPILEQLPGDATLIAIDTNPDFIDYLKADIRDSRFVPVLGSAADVEAIVKAHGFDHADYVLSGLPFSTLPAGVGPAIAAATHRVLRKDGGFLVYQFRARARDFLAAHFARIDKGFEWWNAPPCFLFWGWKD
jgi:phospholipid N-methyltransferase